MKASTGKYWVRRKTASLRFYAEAATKCCSSKKVFCTCFKNPWNIFMKEFIFLWSYQKFTCITISKMAATTGTIKLFLQCVYVSYFLLSASSFKRMGKKLTEVVTSMCFSNCCSDNFSKSHERCPWKCLFLVKLKKISVWLVPILTLVFNLNRIFFTKIDLKTAAL